ncbi:MAG: GNAT family N-acetyltransferase [Nitrospiraceae bacterium]
MTRTLLVRPAKPDDLNRLIEFSLAMALETEGRTLEPSRLRQGILSILMEPTRGFLRVAETPDGNGARVVGQLMVTYEWSDWRNATFWWIQSVYVTPAYRRQGVYRALHDAIRREARATPDVCGIRLYVEEANRIAQQAYRQAGMRVSSYLVYEEDFILSSQKPKKERT